MISALEARDLCKPKVERELEFVNVMIKADAKLGRDNTKLYTLFWRKGPKDPRWEAAAKILRQNGFQVNFINPKSFFIDSDPPHYYFVERQQVNYGFR